MTDTVENDKVVLKRDPIITNIALGQGGYNSVRAFLDKPFAKAENCFAINYETDLRSANLIDPANKIALSGYGAGHDRNKAKNDLLQEIQTKVSEELAKKINPKSDKIYIHLAGGGGCGSGIGVLVAGLVSNENFIPDRHGRRIPVEVILYKPADTTDASNVGEWQNFNECLREFNVLVERQAVSLYIADLSSSNLDNPTERNAEVNREVAELLYRFDCVNYLSNYSNLDFEDRYKLSITPGCRGLLRFDEKGNYSSPFVLPNGESTRRMGYEIEEGQESIVSGITKTLGVESLDKSFGGIYPKTANACYPFIIYSGYDIPLNLKNKAQNTVSELEKKRQNLVKAEKSQAKDSFDLIKQNRESMEAANQMANVSLEDLLGI